MKKTIYSPGDLSKLPGAANKRYLEFISSFDNKEVGREKLMKVSSSMRDNNRHYRGFNFFDKKDLHTLRSVLRGEFNISGFRNKDLRHFLKFTASPG